jgi:hypothetical protein
MPNPTKIVNQSIVLANLPVSPTDAANKQYVDNIYNAAIANSGNPGIIGYFATSSAPTGWVKANGAVLPIASYQALFDVLPKQGNGNTIWWQPGDGPLNFRIPDLRGVFPRGWDDGRGIDSGRGFGTDQGSLIGSHNHPINDPGHVHSTDYWIRPNMPSGWGSSWFYPGANYANTGYGSGTYGNRTGISVGSSGGVETRPVNLSLLACIKF